MGPVTHIRISASRLKTLKDCSLLFWYTEIQRLPERTHHKTLQGSCIHSLFECLLNPKRVAVLRAILKDGFSLTAHPVVARFIRFYDAKHGIAPYEMEAMEGMLRVAFLTIKPHFDIYFAALDAGQPAPFRYYTEKRFQMQVGEATMSGFIDLLLVWPDRALVIDLKSQGKKWTVAEVPHNVQAILYQLACLREFGLIPAVDFVMVRHAPSKRYPRMHLQSVAAPSRAHLAGLETYIESMYGVVNQFGMEEALSHPHDSISFCEKVCQFREPFTYWARVKRDAPETVIKTYRAPVEVEEDEELVERKHEGCLVRWRG